MRPVPKGQTMARHQRGGTVISTPMPTEEACEKATALWMGTKSLKYTLLEKERCTYKPFDLKTHDTLDRHYRRTTFEIDKRYSWREPVDGLFDVESYAAILVSQEGNVIRVMTKKLEDAPGILGYHVLELLRIPKSTPNNGIIEKFDPRYIKLIVERFDAAGGKVDASMVREVIHYMNRYFACVRNTLTVYEKQVKDGGIDIHVHTFDRFEKAYSDVEIAPTGKCMESIASIWLKSEDRRWYVRTVFADKPDEDSFNLFRGLQYTLESVRNVALDEVLPLIEHIYNIWCKRDDRKFDYVIHWMAHLVQRPFVKLMVALVLHSRQGAGKGTVVDKLNAIFGTHFKTLKLADVTGNFNSALLDTLVVFFDEVLYAGDKATAASLKTLITEKRHMVRRKYVDGVEVDNHVNCIFATNEPWAAPVEKDCRRYWVLDLDNKYAKKDEKSAEYFKRLNAVSPAAFYKFLMGLDITNFNPTRMPMTEDTRKQKEIGLDSVPMWWLAMIDDHNPHLLGGEKGAEMPKADIYGLYRHWMECNATERKVESNPRFWMVMKELTGYADKNGGCDGSRVRMARLPTYEMARERFAMYVSDTSFFAERE